MNSRKNSSELLYDRTNEVKPYLFSKNNAFSKFSQSFNSCISIWRQSFNLLKFDKSIFRRVAKMFEEYGYNLVIDFVTNEAEIQKNQDGIVYKIPYNLVADTLQRAIFHNVAIWSNKNSLILFEEPENHSFPPYVRELAMNIIESSSNQFFIATHSPYLLNTIISEAPRDEVSINVVKFENYETKIKQLSEDEISEISNYGIDIFFNLEMFS
ncbi:MAG: AAA family ATPase [Bacteroidia bacterium]